MPTPNNPHNRVVEYLPAGPVIKAFHESPAFVRAIMGPLGSGKSTACVIEILRRAAEQKPSPDGIRKTRWAIIRNSFPELRSTTLKTWAEWAPLTYGRVSMDSPFIHHIKIGDLDIEVFFMALDSPEDARKLLSLELTGAWINEAREVVKPILDALTGRVGRFPSKKDGGATWSGILLDTNPCDTSSWYYKAAEESTPEGWNFFRQPGGLSSEAENLFNLPDRYYQRLVAGKEQDWVQVYCNAEYGYLIEGKPVYPQYKDSFHCARNNIDISPNFGLLLGVDFGLTPACVIAQKMPDGRWLVIDELVTDNTGVKRFAELLVTYISTKYPEHVVLGAWGDPSGNQRASTDEETALEVMNHVTNWKWRPAPGDNTLTQRLESVRGALNRVVDGNPGILISPKCQMLRKGFVSGYHYKLAKSGNGAVIHETPNKNEYSHAHDALQYLLMGGGEFDLILNRLPNHRKNRPRKAIGYDKSPFDY